MLNFKPKTQRTIFKLKIDGNIDLEYTVREKFEIDEKILDFNPQIKGQNWIPTGKIMNVY